MKRFHFSLRSVAVVRAHRELRARQALAAALRACAEAEARSAAARARAVETASEIAAGRSRPVRAADQVMFAALHRRECALAAEADAAAAAARAEVANRRDACIEASRQLKIVTRLEERARAAHRDSCFAFEQQQMDELSRSPSAVRGGGSTFSVKTAAGRAEGGITGAGFGSRPVEKSRN
jgi:flagellar export protein FliJ